MSWSELPSGAKAECAAYVVIAVTAFVGTQWALIGMLRGGATGSQVWSDLTMNSTVVFTTIDLTMVFLAALVFTIVEGRRIRVRWWLLYPILCSVIGVSFGLPLFLVARRLRLGA